MLTARQACAADLARIDALLARSYPALLKSDYPPSVLVTALPIISRAQPGLVSSGRYFVVADDAGRVVGAGGWSCAGGSAGSTAHVRHVVTDFRRTREGIGRTLLGAILADAKRNGAQRMACLSTRTAVPFYAAMGFVTLGPRDVALRAGIVFPVIEMRRGLDDVTIAAREAEA